ncbi:MAG TPA: nucleotidyltransferase family protein [Negativicutes bacterium]
MKALILAAGKGTRLRPLTDYVPKPMVPLQGKPLMEWVILHLISCGIKECVVAVSYLAEQIKNYFGNGKRWGIDIQYSCGTVPAGKAGEIWRARHLLSSQEEPFLVVPGDTLCHLDYRELFDFHHQHGGAVSVAFSTQYRLEVGLADIDERNIVRKFLEKSNLDRPVSMGSYMLDGRIFPYIKKFHPEKQEVDLPGDIFPVLFTEGVPIYGFVRDFAWWDIGRINDYEALVQMPPEQVGQILRWT